MKKSLLLLVFLLGCLYSSQSQIISTIAGTVTSGFSGDGGAATAAELFHPKGTVADDTGNIYIADADNNVIRKVTPGGIITTFAGLPGGGYAGDGGAAAVALFNRPNSVVRDHRGNMYVCDADNHAVRKINALGIVNTIAGDGTPGSVGEGVPATAAELNFPGSIALDDTGNVYIADEYNNKIRKVDTFGIITTFAGTGATGYAGEGGAATAADIGFPFGVAVDHAGNVYFSLTLGNRICKVNTLHVITTVAGTGGPGAYSGDTGPATAAEFDTPWGIAVDAPGNLYITDNANERIRKVNVVSGIVTTVAGNGSSGFLGDGSPAVAAKLKDPAGVYVDDCGNIFIADYNNHRVRKVDNPATHLPSFTGGHSQALTVCMNTPRAIDSLLAVIDSDAGQFETWSVVTAPTHGTAAAAFNTISTGGVIMPSGLLYSPTIGYTGADSFRVRIADCSGADTTTIHVTVISCTTGLTLLAGRPGESKIFPNPNDGEFAINVYSEKEEQVQVTVTNLVGKKVMEFTMPTNRQKQIKLNAPGGIYFISTTTAQGTWCEKFMITR